MKRTSVTLLLSAILFTGAQASITAVDLELALLVDVSGSVSSADYHLMMEGYALAFENATIHDAIAAGAMGSIAVNMVQFDNSNAEVIDWTMIGSASEASNFATTIRSVIRAGDSGTGVAQGIEAAVASFVDNGFDGPRQVIDLSGDGEENEGGDVPAARDAALAGEIDTINAISIDDPSGEVRQFYEDNAIGGTGGFATSADDFTEFEREILAKLNAEIRDIPLTSSGFPLAVAHSAALLMVGGMFEDVNGRLFRSRSGFREPSVSAVAGSWTAPAPAGGMEKGGILPPPGRKAWEVFGSVGLYYNDVDGIKGAAVPGANQPVVVPGFEMTMIHGTVGIEYDFEENYSIGAALLGATGEIETDAPASDLDVDSLGVAVYGSYYREDALGALGSSIQGDYWADLLYAFQDTDFELSNGPGDAEAQTHRVEFNTGLNFVQGQVTHGPLGGLVWADGDVDPSGAGAKADIESLVTRLGYQASYKMATSMGTVIPQVRATWEHEFEDDAVRVGGLNLGEPDSDKAVLGAGVLWHFHQDFYTVLDYQARLGDNADSHNVVLRVGGFF